jgi:hypothetical protein
MYRKYIYVVKYDNTVQTWSNLKLVCKIYGLSYFSLIRKKKYPITWKGYTIHKCIFNPGIEPSKHGSGITPEILPDFAFDKKFTTT